MAKKITISSEHRLHDLTSVSKMMRPLIKQVLGNNGMINLELLSSWEEIVGSTVAAYTIPQKLSFKKDESANGCLTLMVLAGAFAMEIQQNSPKIIEKINSFLGFPAVATLKIVQNSNPENFLIRKKPIDKLKKKVVSAEEENYITELVKDVNSEELRRSLENIGKAVFSRRQNQE